MLNNDSQITVAEAAQFVGYSTTTIQRLISKGVLPQPLRLGNKKFFDKDEFLCAIKRYSEQVAATRESSAAVARKVQITSRKEADTSHYLRKTLANE